MSEDGWIILMICAIACVVSGVVVGVILDDTETWTKIDSECYLLVEEKTHVHGFSKETIRTTYCKVQP